MFAAFISAVAGQVAPPVPLEVMPLAHARGLDGHRVRVSLDSAKPSQFWEGRTVIGCEDRPDGIERGAILTGERADVDRKTVIVVGTLRVIDHPGRLIGDVAVPAWTEIRVEE